MGIVSRTLRCYRQKLNWPYLLAIKRVVQTSQQWLAECAHAKCTVLGGMSAPRLSKCRLDGNFLLENEGCTLFLLNDFQEVPLNVGAAN